MKLPIQYALYYPERRYLPGKRLDFTAMTGITIDRPDTEVFEGLKLAYEAGRKGGNAPTVFNAANEFAVAQFLDRKIGYTDIYRLIKKAYDTVPFIADPTLEEILETEQKTYEVLR